MVGMTMTSIKFIGELTTAGSFTDEPFLIILFASVITFDSLFLLFSVNLSMKYYD